MTAKPDGVPLDVYLANIRRQLTAPFTETPGPEVHASLHRSVREGERMRVARFLRDHGHVAAALIVQSMGEV